MSALAWLLGIMFAALAAIRAIAFWRARSHPRRALWFSEAMAALYGAALYLPSAAANIPIPPALYLHVRSVMFVILCAALVDAIEDYKETKL